MNVQKKISFLLMLIFLFATAVASNINFYILEKSAFDIEIVAAIVLIFLLYVFLAWVMSRVICNMIMKVNIIKDEEANDINLDYIVSNIPGGMVRLTYSDDKWHIDYVSLWCYKLLGYKNEIKKDQINNIIYERDIVVVKDVLNNILLGSEYGEADIRIRKADSQLIWVKVKVNGIYNSSGELERVSAIIIDIDDVKRENEKLMFKAQRDSLTGVFNKGAMIEKVESYIIESKLDAAFVIVDIDNFKLFNDLLGHVYGDEALVVIAQYLKLAFGEESYIGRLGGDEFCVFVTNIKSNEYVEAKVEKFLELLRKTKIGNEKKISLLVSIGIADYPVHGKSFRQLYINSDKALYRTKYNGKNGYSIFE